MLKKKGIFSLHFVILIFISGNVKENRIFMLEKEQYNIENKFFTPEEARDILTAQLLKCKRGKKSHSFNAEINYFMLSFLFNTACRISEFCNIELKDLKLYQDKPAIRVIGKGAMQSKNRETIKKYTRNLFISTHLINVLELWLGVRAEILETYQMASNKLLIGRKGQEINRFTAWHRFKNCCKQAGVDVKTTHSTRHTAGTILINQTRDLELVRERLGHRSYDLIQVYSKVYDDRQQKAGEELSKAIQPEEDNI